MTDSPPYPDPNGDADMARGRAPGTPRWVKLLGVLAIVAIVLVVAVMLLAGGQHGPGRHIPAGGTPAGQTAPASVVDGIPSAASRPALTGAAGAVTRS